LLVLTESGALAGGEGGTESKATREELAARRLQSDRRLGPEGRALHIYLLHSHERSVP
jgi:hypothetical protein